MAASRGSHQVEISYSGDRDLRRGDEKALFVFLRLQHQTIQADVVDVDPVRQVPPRLFLSEGDVTLDSVAIRRDDRGNGLPGSDRELEDAILAATMRGSIS